MIRQPARPDLNRVRMPRWSDRVARRRHALEYRRKWWTPGPGGIVGMKL